MDKHIFIINGSGGSGKDTFVKMIADGMATFEVWNFSSIDRVKDFATQMGWDGEKTEKDRKFLSDLKLLLTEYNDLPFRSLVKTVLRFKLDKTAKMLFIHIREPKEIERAVKEFGAKTILVERPSIEQIKSNMADKNVKEYKEYDYLIVNKDLNGLKETAKLFISSIEKRERKKIFCDLDGCIYDTVQTICKLYNEDFRYYPNYKYIYPEDIRTWNFKECTCATEHQINSYFNQPRFFDELECFPNVLNYLRECSNKFDIVIVTMGDVANLRIKKLWAQQYMPFASFIGLDFNTNKDKSSVDMKGGIFIDDVSNNLESSNADYKICFGDCYDWNKDFEADFETCYDAFNWTEVKSILDSIIKTN